VPVTANGRSVGAYQPEELERPFLPGPTSVVTQPDGRASALSGNRYLGPLELLLYPLDVTASTRRPELRGQLLVVAPSTPTTLHGGEKEAAGRAPFDAIDRRLWKILLRGDPSWTVSAVPTPEGLLLTITLGLHGAGWWTRRTLRSLLCGGRRLTTSRRRGWLDLHDQRLVTWQDLGVRRPLDLARWCHNGVTLPDVPARHREVLGGGHDPTTLGVISLVDDLRPDLTVSRSAIIGAPFPLRSAIEFVRRGSPLRTSPAMRLDVLDVDVDLGETPPHTVGEVLADPLVADGRWDDVPVFWELEAQRLSEWADGREGLRFDSDLTSVRSLKRQAESATKPVVEIRTGAGVTGFRRVLTASLVQSRLNVRAVFGRESRSRTGQPSSDVALRVWSAESPPLLPGLLRFRPLFFVRYETASATLLKRQHMPVNLDHPLAQWFAGHADTLAARAPAVFARLRDALDRDPATTPTPNDEVNRLLDRVARVLPELKPGSDAYLAGAVRTGEWHSR